MDEMSCRCPCFYIDGSHVIALNIMILLKQYYDLIETLLWSYWNYIMILLKLYYDIIETILWYYWNYIMILLKFY